MASQIWTRIDYDRPGRQTGALHLPHSVDRSAYGTITIPMTVIAGGRGPTLLLTAGTHGDEYEGQIALTRLARTLDPGALQGRVIILPMLNAPAARAGRRTSPVDGGNLNRAYPGDAYGGPTAAIADYVATVLFPMTDVYQDFHAGGGSLNYLPFVSIRISGDEGLDSRALAAARAFGAARLMVWGFSPDPRLSTAESNRQGIVSLGGEFGGGGAVSREGLDAIERGLPRLMAHLGMIDRLADAPAPPLEFEVLGRDHYVYAEEDGLFEPEAALGDRVRAGQSCGTLHFVEDPLRPGLPHPFHRDGILVCQRHPGRVERGDCLAHLATERS